MVIKKFRILIIFLLFSFLLLFMMGINYSAEEVFANNGILDLSNLKIKDKEIFKLSGEWEYFNGVLLSPDDFEKNSYEKDKLLDIPNKFSEGINKSGIGFGTLRLNIKTEDKERLYGLKFEYMLTSYNVYVDGKKYAEVGNVAINEKYAEGIYKPSVIEFYGGDNIDIVIQTSNFKDSSSFFRPVYFGLADDIKKYDLILIFRDIAVFAGLVMLSIFYLNYYLIILDDKKNIYFALMCIFFAIRVLFINERIAIRIFSDMGWDNFFKIIYTSLFLSFLFLLKYFGDEINTKNSKKIINLISVLLLFIGFFVIFGGLLNVDIVLNIFEIIAISSFIWIIFNLIIKFVKGEAESGLLLAGFLVLFLGFIVDILKDMGLIEIPYISSICIFMFFLIQSVILSKKFSNKLVVYESLSNKNQELVMEMKKINDNLELVVEKRTEELKDKTLELENSNFTLKKLNGYLENISYIDELTKIPNRRMFFKEIEILLEIGLQNKNGIGLLIIDIDYFKLYNDFYGHSKGDWCLFNIAQTIDNAASEFGYFCARYGGEEFVVVGMEKEKNDILNLAKTIMLYIEELEIENENSPGNKYITVSIGGCSYNVNGKVGVRRFIDCADDMLYEAKNSGRNSFKFNKI